MNLGSPASLDAQGRPIFLAGEIQQVLQEEVDLYDGDVKRLRGGRGVVTTHRLLYLHSQANIAWALHNVVAAVEKASLLGFSSPKVSITLSADKPAFIQFSFKNGGCSRFSGFVNTALARRSWETHPATKRSRTDSETPLATARPLIGVSGLLARMEAARADESAQASEALSDISALMENVRRVADTAQIVADKLHKRAAGAAASAEDAPSQAGSLHGIARDFGLQNPVTRGQSGVTYIPALAREVAVFTRPKLAAAGGVLSLTDIFCLYNRARGTDLVSPHDFLLACGSMQPMQLGMHMHTLPSELRVLQLDSHSLQAVQQRVLLDLAGGGGSVDGAGFAYTTAQQCSNLLKVSLPVATQYLFSMERSGLLCRDTSLHGNRFYTNTLFK